MGISLLNLLLSQRTRRLMFTGIIEEVGIVNVIPLSAYEIIREEGFDEIADWFETLAKAERSHAGRFQKALDTLAE